MRLFSAIDNDYSVMKTRPKLIFVIGDLHIPFHNRKAMRWIKKTIKKLEAFYKCKATVISIGDLCDEPYRHSMHHKSHFIESKEDIYKRTVRAINELKKVVPEMIIVEGNHDNGAGTTAIRDNRDLRDVRMPHEKYPNMPEEWRYVPDLTIAGTRDWLPLYFVHGLSKNTTKNSCLAQKKGMSCVQGHFHSLSQVTSWLTKEGKNIFNTFTGCLVDPHCPAMEYADKSVMMNDIRLSSTVIFEDRSYNIPLK